MRPTGRWPPGCRWRRATCCASSSGGGVGPAAALSYGIEATTALTGSALTLTARNDDRVGAGEGVLDTGDIGDVLRYRIEIVNPGTGPATRITVTDRTPAFTALATAAPTPVVIATGLTCTLVQPGATNLPGYEGTLQWQCPGPVPPGTAGPAPFDVRVNP